MKHRAILRQNGRLVDANSVTGFSSSNGGEIKRSMDKRGFMGKDHPLSKRDEIVLESIID